MPNQNMNGTGTDYRLASTKKTFSSVVNNDIFPSKNQAIIFSHMEGAPAAYYARKVADKLGGANNVLHCMKISKERVRMYLKTRQIAEKFMNEGGEIEINQQVIKARWYIQENNDKKLIITNVPPHVPHDIILDVFKTHGITPSSPMKFLHLTQEDGLTNILSEKRFVYIPSDSAAKFPSSEIIKYDGDEYRAFFNDATAKCYICHQFGHISQTCEFAYKQPTGETTIDITDTTDTLNDRMEIPHDDDINIPSNLAKKRPPPSDNDSTTCSQVDINLLSEASIQIIHEQSTKRLEDQDKKESSNNDVKKKEKGPKKKKPKTQKKDEAEPTVSVKELLKPLKDNFDNNIGKYPMSFSNFTVMMEMVKGQDSPIATILEITNNIPGVIEMLIENYPLLQNRTMKSRFTRLKNKLIKTLPPGTESKTNVDVHESSDASSETETSE